jgi:hypothetical protein
MAHVPDEPVGRAVEHPVHRDGHFDHAEVRAEVPAAFAQDVDELVPDFLRERGQLLEGEQLYVGG